MCCLLCPIFLHLHLHKHYYFNIFLPAEQLINEMVISNRYINDIKGDHLQKEDVT